MKSCFVPNISSSDTLRIIEVKEGSVIVRMENSDCRGVFPLESFQYWIRKSSLIPVIDDHHEKTS